MSSLCLFLHEALPGHVVDGRDNMYIGGKLGHCRLRNHRHMFLSADNIRHKKQYKVSLI